MEKKVIKVRAAFSIDGELLKEAKAQATAERRNFSNWLCTIIETALKERKVKK